ncbi:hypothetical protein AJ78_03853 [Emergomyces pasteurianus Ep9510]|uniref:Uncharacterized protein n=1 Tax=Emergomyces pasteurianus Ep9510 TaxID=1447872 RepID=A0A1J9QJ74_9EURO|nr:hypothetical protein AJ78_03853 [Emergomyces pasteurianus Ep9510]
MADSNEINVKKDADIAGQSNIKIDFMNANISIDAGYAQTWARDIQLNERSTDFLKMVNLFKE